MRIDSDGNVGIGTTSPANKLHVDGGTTGTDVDVARFSSNTGAFAIKCSDLSASNPTWTLRTFDGEALAFGDGNTENMRIDASGNLLVGKTGVDLANVGVEARSNGTLAVTKGNGTVAHFNRKTSDGTILDFRKDGTTVGSISVTASATAYNTSSDERLKENIQDSADAGSKIDAIQVRQFDWKSDGSHQDYGVIAQELLEVAPEAVTEGETEDDMMSVDYSKLVPTLIKEIQTLRNRVAQLENN
jgi:hypothetical protein